MALLVLGGFFMLLTVLVARKLWISGDVVWDTRGARSVRSVTSLGYVLFLLVVLDVVFLAAFIGDWRRARKR